MRIGILHNDQILIDLPGVGCLVATRQIFCDSHDQDHHRSGVRIVE